MDAYPGYVYKSYPKMIYSDVWKPLGYKIAKDEVEERELFKSLAPKEEPKVITKKIKN